MSSSSISIVLLGSTGTGKSAAANTVLGRNHFLSKASSQPVTTESQMVEAQIQGYSVKVIDTPDIFDDDMKPSVRAKHVKQVQQLCGPDARVYLLVLQVSRFTDGQRDVLTKLEMAFGSKVAERTVVVFTRGEDLHRAGMSLQDFLRSSPPGLRKMVDKCGSRCVVFQKNGSNESQLAELIRMVESIFREDRLRDNPLLRKTQWRNPFYKAVELFWSS